MVLQVKDNPFFSQQDANANSSKRESTPLYHLRFQTTPKVKSVKGMPFTELDEIEQHLKEDLQLRIQQLNLPLFQPASSSSSNKIQKPP